MTENSDEKPLIWIVDSDRTPMAQSLEAFADWADAAYHGPDDEPDWAEPPEAVFFSAEMRGGAAGATFARLADAAGGVPLIAVARLRSLAQAVSFFRAGACDYLSLPLDGDDLRERFEAAMLRAAQSGLDNVMVELEPVDRDPGEISLSLYPSTHPESGDMPAAEEDDILARLDGEVFATAEAPITPEPSENDDIEPVDGLPIPTLWEELPCGLLVYDSAGNLVFSNTLGLDLFGHATLAELQDVLENRRAEFKAYAANHKPLADNHWPQVLAAKTRTARSAVISIEKPDKRRAWLRVDCLPHLFDGAISRLSMTIVNLTGELPPLAPPEAAPSAKRARAAAKGKRRK